MIFKTNDILKSELKVYDSLCPVIRDLIWHCNLNVQDIRRSFDNDLYWVQVLSNWSTINYHQLGNKNEVMSQIIWWNSNIKINHKPIMWKNWYEKGIICIEDIVNEDGSCKNANIMGVNWLQLQSIFEAIPET